MRPTSLLARTLAVTIVAVAPAVLHAQTRPASRPAADGPLIWLEALGGSTGEVMKVHVVNPGPDPIEIDGYFALEPVDLSPEEREGIFESVRTAAGNHVEAVIDFYCLEFGVAAPAAGVVYRIAPPAAQEAFAPAARAIEAARRLNEAGLLSPDTNPESYYHAIRQWSIWTLEQRFDQAGFVAAFVEHTRKNAEARGVAWTDAVAAAVRTSGEGRWRDVARILEEA
ncbi:MAG TPA: hypothetical protein VM737_06340, partial [Gemmatimonadota bacterium]|nr:hypothetical protein [Gemmatimonadota bacterium]